MNDDRKTKTQLIRELSELRQRLARLEADDSAGKGHAENAPGEGGCPGQMDSSEGFYRDLFAHMNTVILIIDPLTTRIVDANAAACRFYGYAYADLTQLKISDINNSNQETIKHELERAAAKEKIYSNFQHRAAGGALRDVEIYSDPVQINGKPLLVSVVHDTTERRQAENVLRESEGRFRALAQSASDAIININSDGTIVFWNNAAEKIFGYSAAEISGRPLALVMPERFRQAHQQGIQRMGAGGEAHIIGNTVEVAGLRKDGREFPMELSLAVWETARELFFTGIARDISSRKSADEEIFNSRQMLQSVMDNIPMIVFWKDFNSTYMGCNRICAVGAGLKDAAEIIGKTDFDLPWKELARQYRDDDRLVMETDTPKLGYDEIISQPDGSQAWVRTNKIPLHDHNGKVIGILATSEDITERRQAEQEIEIANERLILWVNDLEQRNQEARLLRQMGDLLQVSNEQLESYNVIKEHMPQLFPTTSGGLYILNDSQALVECAALWGENLQSESCFALDECWALRRGQIYSGRSSTPGLNCRHILKSFSGTFLDIPLMASGEVLGVLHIEAAGEELFAQNVQDLALTLADHLSLSLSNLKLRQTLRYQSIRDALTGLFNRRYMEESLSRELPRAVRKNTTVGIIMLDIDHFKRFNDTFGHEAGDIVLREIGKLLQCHVRAEDIACRYGGEEFILILPDTPQEVALQRAERIREAVKLMQIEYRQQPLGVVSLSLGVSVFPVHGSTADEVLKRADDALYQAKHNGRDRVELAPDPGP